MSDCQLWLRKEVHGSSTSLDPDSTKSSAGRHREGAAFQISFKGLQPKGKGRFSQPPGRSRIECLRNALFAILVDSLSKLLTLSGAHLYVSHQ